MFKNVENSFERKVNGFLDAILETGINFKEKHTDHTNGLTNIELYFNVGLLLAQDDKLSDKMFIPRTRTFACTGKHNTTRRRLFNYCLLHSVLQRIPQRLVSSVVKSSDFKVIG